MPLFKTYLFSVCLLICCVTRAQDLELVMQEGHARTIQALAYSPDGKYLISAGGDNTIKIWETATGKLMHTVKYPEAASHLEFSPDGKKFLMSICDSGMVSVGNAETGQPLSSRFFGYRSYRVAHFSPDGREILCTLGDSISIWNIKLDTMIACLTRNCFFAEYSPDGSKIITLGQDFSITAWDAISHKTLYRMDDPAGPGSASAESEKIRFSSDSKFMILHNRGKGQGAMIYDISNGQKVTTLGANIEFATFLADNKKILTNSDKGTGAVWDLTGKLVSILKDTSQLIQFKRSSYRDRYAPNDNEDAAHPLAFSPDGTTFALADGSLNPQNTNYYNIGIYASVGRGLIHKLSGLTSSLFSAQFSSDGRLLMTGSNDGLFRIWDMSKGVMQRYSRSHCGEMATMVLSPDGKMIAAAENDFSIKIWDLETDSLINVLKGHRGSINMISFSPDSKSLLTASADGKAILWDITSAGIIHTIQSPVNYEVRKARFSPDGSRIIITAFIYNDLSSISSTRRISDGRLLHEYTSDWWYSDAWFYGNDSTRILQNKEVNRSRTLLLVDTGGHSHKIQLMPGNDADQVLFSPDGINYMVSSYFYLYFFKLGDTIPVRKPFPALGSKFFGMNWEKNIVISGDDSRIYLQDIQTQKELCSILTYDSANWVVLHPSGLFDASQGAMEKMYWTKGRDIIAFSQLKNRYWEPGLMAKILNREKLRDVKGMDQIRLQPSIDLGDVVDGLLPIKLTPRDGGYGKVVVSVNGKEAKSINPFVRGSGLDTSLRVQTLNVRIANNALIQPGKPNLISVKAYSADGSVEGMPVEITYTPSGDSSKEKPSFYAVICGVSKFNTTEIPELRFAHTDALAISKAIKLGASRLFGADRTFVYTLTSPGDNNSRPDKKSIHRAFEEIGRKAKPGDILLLYLSGHGTTYTPVSGMTDFYYLTSDVYSSELNDPVVLDSTMISGAEFTEWIMQVPALKQVMILDACHSGAAVNNLLASRGLDPGQVKAVDRMKDRTGMFIISGCAADAVSYEASSFGQGLLTYSLLLAMQGAQLREDKYVDVSTIMNFARDKVPQLASSIRGIQVPELLIPRSGSFDIGMLGGSDRDSIPIAKIKPVFGPSNFINEDAVNDDLNLSLIMDSALGAISDKGEDIVFVDANRQSSDTYTISGIYKKNNAGWELHYTIKNAREAIGPKSFATASSDVNELNRKLMQQVNADIHQIRLRFRK